MIKNRKILTLLLTIVTIAVVVIPCINLNNVTAQTQTDSLYNVKDFGAKGNGLVDETNAIVAAINKAKSNGGGIVFIPAGVYKITQGNIFVPSGVSIVGTLGATTGPWQNYLDAQDKTKVSAGFVVGSASTYTKASLLKGTWIVSAHGEGETNAPATFILDGNTSFSKIGFVSLFASPLTSASFASPPHIAVDTSKMTDTKGPIDIVDISLSNCYTGIAVTQGDEVDDFNLGEEKQPVSIGKVTIKNIMGSPLFTGILVKGIASEVYLENIQFNYAVYSSKYVEERTLYAHDIVLAAASNVVVDRVLSFGAAVGLKTEVAYNNLGVNLKATGLNLENRFPVYLTAAGNYDVRSSFFFLTNFGNARKETFYRTLYIVEDEDSAVNSSYTFKNIFLQDAGVDGLELNNKDYDNALIDITVKDNATTLFENIETYGQDNSSEPNAMFYYTHNGTGTSSCTFRNIAVFSYAAGQPLINVGGTGYKNGEAVMEYCRFTSSNVIPTDNSVKFVYCTQNEANTNTIINN